MPAAHAERNRGVGQIADLRSDLEHKQRIVTKIGGRQKGVEAADWTLPEMPRRAVEEYLAVLDDAGLSQTSALTVR